MIDLGIAPRNRDANNIVLVLLHKLSNNSLLRISPCGYTLWFLMDEDLVCEDEEIILSQWGILPLREVGDSLRAVPVVGVNAACEQLSVPGAPKKPSVFFTQPYEDEDTTDEVEPDWDYL